MMLLINCCVPTVIVDAVCYNCSSFYLLVVNNRCKEFCRKQKKNPPVVNIRLDYFIRNCKTFDLIK